MQLTLEIKNPSDWELLLIFLTQKGIDFQISGKKTEANGKIKTVSQKQNRLQMVAHMKGILPNLPYSKYDAYEQ
ncbi:MAG: hypothetical protein ACKVU0_19150 [Saprospiraceae bacterium]